MGRATCGGARHRRKLRVRSAVQGYHGSAGRTYRLAREAIVRAGVNAYRDRRRRKREFRSLWVTRLTAACRARGISYSRLVFGLQAASIEINRKLLSELAISNPSDFDALVEIARKHQPHTAAA